VKQGSTKLAPSESNVKGKHGGAYAWIIVVCLMLANTMSFVDRQIFALLIEQIKADFRISDTAVSLLHGFAFAIFYVVFGFFFGRLSDSMSRVKIIAFGIFFWSLMTALCGMAKGYISLFLARLGVGVGEATLSPAAHSLLAASFPREALGKATSLYSVGVYLGAGFAYLVGGAAIQYVASLGEISIPLLGVVKPWQVAFMVVAFPGIFVAGLFLLLKEPVREIQAGSHRRISISEKGGFVSLLKERRRFYFAHMVGFAMFLILGQGYLAWLPTFFMRTFSWEAGDVGLVMGLVILIAGTAGALSTGLCVDYMYKKGYVSGAMWISAVIAGATTLFAVAAPLVNNEVTAVVLMIPTIFLLSAPWGVAVAAIQGVTPEHYRGRLAALYVFSVNITGMAVGPTMLALFTDYIFGSEGDLRYSLALAAAIFAPLSAACLFAGVKPYRNLVLVDSPLC